MIFNFFNFLKDSKISFVIMNGYKDIVDQVDTDSDIDILFKKVDFINIENIISDFCLHYDLQIVQVLHHEVLAKNIFLFDKKTKNFLNLDLYGDLSRNNVVFASQDDVFNNIHVYKDIPILSYHYEFIYYLVKKLDKNDLKKSHFTHLKYLYEIDENNCMNLSKKFFQDNHSIVEQSFVDNFPEILYKNRGLLLDKVSSFKSFKTKHFLLNLVRVLKRIVYPTGFNIVFLGPDGAGKSTIVEHLQNQILPFRRKDYFHLKPLKNKNSEHNVVINPHKDILYSKTKSYIKLIYFIYQYNLGWMRNIVPLQIRSSLVIFDRYFDDLLVDYKRYRYGGSIKIAKIIKYFIPKPDLYFILIADPSIVYKRKQEVDFKELERQIKEYKLLVDNKKYIKINVNRDPKAITEDIIEIIMEKMNERY